jgi:antirestriction protein ArdC
MPQYEVYTGGSPGEAASAATPVTPIVLTADNAKDKLKEITDRLEAGIKGIFESDRYAAYLKTLSKFHNYSMGNCILIAMQKPDATHIAGYSAWQNNFKRNVMKGEKGIKIIAPTPYTIRKEMERIDPKNGSVIIGKDGKPEMEEVEVKIPAFRVATVFDISQTEGEPLPEIGVNELTGDVAKFKDFLTALEKSSPVPIGIEDIKSGAKGYYEQVEKRIAIQGGMSELQTLKTAIHEIAHARLHDIDRIAPKDVQRPDRDTREVEAESVAFTVCNYYGLDTSDYSFGYIAGWSGDKELATLKASLDTIRAEANSIITEVDGHMAQLAKERDEVMNDLIDETGKTFQMSIDDDIARSGAVRPDTPTAIKAQGFQYKDGVLSKQPAPVIPESPIKTAEMSTEQNLNMIDGVFNNSPTVAELEAKAKSGEPISVGELAEAIKAENVGQTERKDTDARVKSEVKAKRQTPAQKAAWSMAQSQKAWDYAQGKGQAGSTQEKKSIRQQLEAGKEQISRDKPAQERVNPRSRDMGERT